ncbi:hypothetical protein J41TS12_10640 [Paenibacillus antibioticophila]|uniref:YqzN/YkzM domain-containing protein n=1 Tax=Paenibacillus antibioticophila TaxID=1274374 RepID=A0A919XRI7_9BACL|nr:hypothetical protein [Paenibacillus antibioticophila]GIO36203.1 hypothetical protein J41TS12_10640 [Paenibacillus antibioticophila]
MAEKPEKQNQPAREPVTPRYPVEELAANAEALFSVRPEVLAGALHGVTSKELSVDEAKLLVKQFLGKKVN